MPNELARHIAEHAVTGSYWQPSGCWTTFCRCEQTFDGATKDDALNAWAEHLATLTAPPTSEERLRDADEGEAR